MAMLRMEISMVDKKPAARRKDKESPASRGPQPERDQEVVDADAEALAQDLAKLNHRRMMRRVDSALFRDVRLIEWMAKDARDSASDGLGYQAWSEDEILQVARSIQSSVATARCKLRRIEGSPEFHVPEFAGSAPTVLEEARRAGAAPCLDLAVAAGIGRELWDEECGSWIKLPGDMPRGNYVALKVAGESMQPLLHPGDVMLVRLEPVPSTGDVVIARVDDDQFVVKRVGRVTKLSIELLSVNPEFAPLQIARSSNSIVGTVLLSWCDHKSLPRK